MGKKYEIALSYAHKDQKIADLIGEQLKLVFADGFFMDGYRPEELALAELFEEKLRDIFRRADYAVILYSENYSKGQFATVERKQILEKEKREKESHCFIINIDDCRKIDDQMHGLIYMPLYINKPDQNNNGTVSEGQEEKWRRIHEDIKNIIQNNIKKKIISQTAEKRKEQAEYLLRVQTLCPYGNTFHWDRDYDWNILGKTFINEADGRCLKKDTSWQQFWQYIDADFEWIKSNLNSKPDVKRRIHLNCHLSIAYKLGQMYGDLRQASGNRNLVLVSSNRNQNIEFTFHHTVSERKIEDFCREYQGNCHESADIACVISVKPKEQGNVLETVRQFLNRQGLKYCKIFLFQKEILIEDAEMLESMAGYLRKKMMECRTGSGCKIHLFPDTTAPLMFALGARSVFPGTVQLYEYNQKEDSYIDSLEN